MGLFGPKVPEISAGELQQLLQGTDSPFVLDVRTPAEFNQGHIPQATLIPLSELGQRLHEVPKDRHVVAVCRSGARSLTASKHLIQAGYKVSNLQGGMMRWTGPTK